MKQDKITENELSNARPLPLIGTDTFEEHKVSVASSIDEIVFDLFCGGGSTAVNAKQMGCKYIGADID